MSTVRKARSKNKKLGSKDYQYFNQYFKQIPDKKAASAINGHESNFLLAKECCTYMCNCTRTCVLTCRIWNSLFAMYIVP